MSHRGEVDGINDDKEPDTAVYATNEVHSEQFDIEHILNVATQCCYSSLLVGYERQGDNRKHEESPGIASKGLEFDVRHQPTGDHRS